MTYLLPGSSETVSPKYAKDVELSRSIQGAGNQIIREISKENRIDLRVDFVNNGLPLTEQNVINDDQQRWQR